MAERWLGWYPFNGYELSNLRDREGHKACVLQEVVAKEPWILLETVNNNNRFMDPRQ